MSAEARVPVATPSAGSGSRVPASYWRWLAAIGVSLLGSQVQTFALGWAAAGHGASLAALVITAALVPGLVLMLAGGAVADARGPWLVMVASDGAMCAATAALAVLAGWLGTPVWLLLSAAVVTGVSNAFYTPASGTIPRRLVPPESLGKAMAARSVVQQVVSLLGAPLGGVIVAAAGLAAAAGLNAVSFAVIFVMLVAARRVFAGAEPARQPGSLLRRAAAGVSVAARDGVLRPLLLVVAAVALCMLPVTSLLVPLLVRSQGWPASAAGLVLGVETVASGIVIVVVMARGTSRAPGLAACAGVVAAGAGTCGLGLAAGVLPALLAAAAAVGLGLGLFGSHVGPVVLAATPDEFLSRLQAVLTLCQTLPLVIGLNAGALLVSGAGVRGALLVMGAAVGVVGVLAGASRPVRRASISLSGEGKLKEPAQT